MTTVTSRLRIGIAGLGRLGRRHADNLARRVPRAELFAACSPVQDELAWVRNDLGVANLYGDYLELLADPRVDAAASLPRLFNATVRVKEWEGEVVFLHEVIPGAADHSYGIQVAKLAGLPASVIDRAKVVLAALEAEDRTTPRGFEDLPLFAVPIRPAASDPRQSALEALLAALAAVHPDELSPREALEALYALKQKVAGQT